MIDTVKSCITWRFFIFYPIWRRNSFATRLGEQTKLNLAQLDDENNLMTRMGCINHFPFFDHFSLVLNPDFINCCLGILYWDYTVHLSGLEFFLQCCAWYVPIYTVFSGFCPLALILRSKHVLFSLPDQITSLISSPLKRPETFPIWMVHFSQQGMKPHTLW